MTKVNFYDSIDDSMLKFAVIIAKHNGKWVVRTLPVPAQKKTRNLSCGSLLVGAGGFEPPKH